VSLFNLARFSRVAHVGPAVMTRTWMHQTWQEYMDFSGFVCIFPTTVTHPWGHLLPFGPPNMNTLLKKYEMMQRKYKKNYWPCWRPQTIGCKKDMYNVQPINEFITKQIRIKGIYKRHRKLKYYHNMCSKICLLTFYVWDTFNHTCMLHATTNKCILLSDLELKVVFLKLQVWQLVRQVYSTWRTTTDYRNKRCKNIKLFIHGTYNCTLNKFYV